MNAPVSVRATMNYSVDNGIPPDYYFYEPDPSLKLNPLQPLPRLLLRRLQHGRLLLLLHKLKPLSHQPWSLKLQPTAVGNSTQPESLADAS